MKNPTYKESTATLVEVAAKAGVSRQTASRILGSGAHKHKQATVDKVKAVAESMGYRPNLLAKSIVSGRTYSIGVLIPKTNSRDGFFKQVENGIQHALQNTGLIPIVLQTSSEAPEREQIHRLVDRRVDGIILIPHGTDVDPDYFQEISSRNIPVVCVNEKLTNVGPVDFVGTAETKGGTAAANYLLGKGHTNIGCIYWDHHSVNLGKRAEGFAKTIQAANVSYQAYPMPTWSLEGNMDTLCDCLSAPNRPTAFFCVSDLYAAMLYKAAEKLGLRIPDDFSVLGYADLLWCELLSPSLSTLRQHGMRIGEEATQLLIERIEGSTTKAKDKRISVELVERNSVKEA